MSIKGVASRHVARLLPRKHIGLAEAPVALCMAAKLQAQECTVGLRCRHESRQACSLRT